MGEISIDKIHMSEGNLIERLNVSQGSEAQKQKISCIKSSKSCPCLEDTVFKHVLSTGTSWLDCLLVIWGFLLTVNLI